MTRQKRNRIALFDAQLKALERQADALQFDIDALPEWVEVTAIVVAYEWGERRHSPRLTQEIDDLLQEVGWALFVHWAELRHARKI